MVLLDHLVVVNMIVIDKKELLNIIGGVNVSGSLIGTFTSAINTVLDVWRIFGTAIRRVFVKKVCPIK